MAGGRIGAMPGDPNWSHRLDLHMNGDISVTGDVFTYRGSLGEKCTYSAAPHLLAEVPLAVLLLASVIAGFVAAMGGVATSADLVQRHG